MVPTQFSDSLESFAKAFGKQGEDGVFRYEPPAVTEETKDEANQGRDEDWFDMSSNPELAKAVAAANEVANRPVEDPNDPLANPAKSAEQKQREKVERTPQPPLADAANSQAGLPTSAPQQQLPTSNDPWGMSPVEKSQVENKRPAMDENPEQG